MKVLSALLLFLTFLFCVEVEAESFLSLFKKAQEHGYKIKYKVVYSSKSFKNTSFMTCYRKGEKQRVDSISHGLETRSYLIGEKAFSCSSASGRWQCYEVSKTDVSESFPDLPSGDREVKYVGTRKISGEEAKCYRYREEDMIVEFCVNAEGLPLYVSDRSSDTNVEMVVIEHSKDVDDSDFKLPAKPISMKDMLKQFRVPQLGK